MWHSTTGLCTIIRWNYKELPWTYDYQQCFEVADRALKNCKSSVAFSWTEQGQWCGYTTTWHCSNISSRLHALRRGVILNWQKTKCHSRPVIKPCRNAESPTVIYIDLRRASATVHVSRALDDEPPPGGLSAARRATNGYTPLTTPRSRVERD